MKKKYRANQNYTTSSHNYRSNPSYNSNVDNLSFTEEVEDVVDYVSSSCDNDD
jgi:hypothetical protein